MVKGQRVLCVIKCMACVIGAILTYMPIKAS